MAERGAGRADCHTQKVLIWIVAHGSCYSLERRSIKSFLDLRRDFQRKSVQALCEVANILQKVVVEDHRWNSGEKTRGGGDERFGDARSDGAQAGGPGATQAGKGINDAPNGSEQ